MFLSGLEIDFKAFKKDKRARQGQNDDESSIPGHLNCSVNCICIYYDYFDSFSVCI